MFFLCFFAGLYSISAFFQVGATTAYYKAAPDTLEEMAVYCEEENLEFLAITVTHGACIDSSEAGIARIVFENDSIGVDEAMGFPIASVGVIRWILLPAGLLLFVYPFATVPKLLRKI